MKHSSSPCPDNFNKKEVRNEVILIITLGTYYKFDTPFDCYLHIQLFQLTLSDQSIKLKDKTER